jgi:hypothetical protein
LLMTKADISGETPGSAVRAFGAQKKIFKVHFGNVSSPLFSLPVPDNDGEPFLNSPGREISRRPAPEPITTALSRNAHPSAARTRSGANGLSRCRWSR